MNRLFLAAGATSGFLAVAAGAFGAHALRTRLTAERLATFQTGAQYQMYHALALLLVGLLGARFAVAGWAFLVGTILFSGSLYALCLTDVRMLGAVTPFGGAAFLVGWGALLVGALRR